MAILWLKKFFQELCVLPNGFPKILLFLVKKAMQTYGQKAMKWRMLFLDLLRKIFYTKKSVKSERVNDPTNAKKYLLFSRLDFFYAKKQAFFKGLPFCLNLLMEVYLKNTIRLKIPLKLLALFQQKKNPCFCPENLSNLFFHKNHFSPLTSSKCTSCPLTSLRRTSCPF